MVADDELLLPLAARRRARIMDVVAQRGHVTIAELAELLHVSPMTVRRDVIRLDEARVVIASRGGVSAKPSLVLPAFEQRVTTHAEQKQQIAAAAARLVVPGSVVSIDPGSTTALLARALPQKEKLTVVTSSFAVMETLLGHEDVEVIALGGTLRREALSFVGARAIAAVEELQVHTHFLAAAAVSARGVFDLTDTEAMVKRSLLDIAQRVVLVADSSKFSRLALSRICDWSRVDVVVTDEGLEPEWRERLAVDGVEVVVAS